MFPQPINNQNNYGYYEASNEMPKLLYPFANYQMDYHPFLMNAQMMDHNQFAYVPFFPPGINMEENNFEFF